MTPAELKTEIIAAFKPEASNVEFARFQIRLGIDMRLANAGNDDGDTYDMIIGKILIDRGARRPLEHVKGMFPVLAGIVCERGPYRLADFVMWDEVGEEDAKENPHE